MPTQVLAIDLIQVLGTVQPRQTLNEDAIADYAEHYDPKSNGKAVLPPLRCFHDGERYILSRGFHRYTAATRAKRGSLECEILQGDERAAILDAMLDNDTHGVRLTPADKRKAVNRLLDDAEWGRLSQTKIAEMANVSRQFVALLIIERKPKGTSEGGHVIDNMTPDSGRAKRKPRDGVKGGIKAATAPVPEESPEVVAVREACKRHKVAVTDSQIASLAENCEADMVDAVIESVKLERQTLERAVETCDVPEPTTEEACEDHNRKNESFCRELTKWVKDNKPDVEYIDDAGRFEVLVQKVKNGCETVRTAKAVICPACNGDGCKTCKSLGYLPKMVAAQITPEK